MAASRTVQVFRYDPASGGSGGFQTFTLQIPDETTTTILDVLLRLQREQDPTLTFRYACRVSMCGSCGMVINGREAMACRTNVSSIPSGKRITIRPLNHFPVLKDLVVDMAPFFDKYEAALPFFEPRQESVTPLQIRPDSRERQDIGDATECIACGCCVSSCTMVHHHDAYTGPAALNRAFTLLADSRDALFDVRLERALESCYRCRTEFNCTEVCPKDISSTRAIKYIQRLALKRGVARAIPLPEPKPRVAVPPDRRTFLRQAGVIVFGTAAAAGLTIVGAGAVLGPALSRSSTQWVVLTALDRISIGDVSTVLAKYERKSGMYTEEVATPVLVSRTADEIVCFNASCPHLGCMVRWDKPSGRFRCACHGGTFGRDGSVLAGPPPRPLDRYRFRVESDHLLVEVA